MTITRLFGAVTGLAMLAACGERDVILPGERLDIRDVSVQQNESRAVSLPAAQVNADWTHRNGGPTHHLTHVALGQNLQPAFAVDIGAGDSRRARITADPVVAGGVVYTLDANAQVTATSVTGVRVWVTDITPANDGRNDASGGGLAVAGGKVFVATGFGELTALDAASGQELWTQDLDAPGGAAPTVRGDLVYLVARDSTAWAIDVNTGRIQWQLQGTPSPSNLSGGAGVAVTDDIAIFPFPSGEIIGAFPQGGLRRWSNFVTGERLGQAVANVSDISGDPVIVGNTAYAANFSGRLVALNIASGERLWTANEGAVSPVWAVGGDVFLVNDLNELVRLDAATGAAIWRVELPQFVETRLRQQRTVFAHYGPVMAGGRLIVASSDGQLRSFDPVSGALVSSVTLPAGAASNPVVANNTLYIVTKAGQLVAFR